MQNNAMNHHKYKAYPKHLPPRPSIDVERAKARITGPDGVADCFGKATLRNR